MGSSDPSGRYIQSKHRILLYPYYEFFLLVISLLDIIGSFIAKLPQGPIF